MVVSKWFKYFENFHPISGEIIQTNILVQMFFFNQPPRKSVFDFSVGLIGKWPFYMNCPFFLHRTYRSISPYV